MSFKVNPSISDSGAPSGPALGEKTYNTSEPISDHDSDLPHNPYDGSDPLTRRKAGMDRSFSHRQHDRSTRLSSRQRMERFVSLYGQRGKNIRHSLAFQYVAIWFFIVFVSVFAQFLLAETYIASAGRLMLLSLTVIAVSSAVGCMAFPHHRPEVVRNFKSWSAGTAILGTVVAVLGRLVVAAADDPLGTDQLVSTVVSFLPLLYIMTVVLPAAGYVIMMARMGNVWRVSTDDKETMGLYTRQDGFQP